MKKIKEYWLVVVAILCIIGGFANFNLASILLGSGILFVWYKELRHSSSVVKKDIAIKVGQWFLVGVGCEMLFHGSGFGGVVVLIIAVLWIRGRFSIAKLSESSDGKFRQSVESDSMLSAHPVATAWSIDEKRKKIRMEAIQDECIRLMVNALCVCEGDRFPRKLNCVRDMLRATVGHHYKVNKIDLFCRYFISV